MPSPQDRELVGIEALDADAEPGNPVTLHDPDGPGAQAIGIRLHRPLARPEARSTSREAFHSAEQQVERGPGEDARRAAADVDSFEPVGAEARGELAGAARVASTSARSKLGDRLEAGTE